MIIPFGEHPTRGRLQVERSHGRDIVNIRLDWAGNDAHEYILTQAEIAALKRALDTCDTLEGTLDEWSEA